MRVNYMEDCIHLKACRRLQCIARNNGKELPRRCTEECSAYVSAEEVAKEVEDAIEWSFNKGADGNDYVEWTDKQKFIEWLRGGA